MTETGLIDLPEQPIRTSELTTRQSIARYYSKKFQSLCIEEGEGGVKNVIDKQQTKIFVSEIVHKRFLIYQIGIQFLTLTY